MKFHLFIIIVFVSLSGCSTFGVYNPATERREFIAISTQEEVSMGDGIHKNLEQQYEFTSAKKYQDRVEKIGQKLVLVSDRQDYEYHFYVIEKDELNAFTTPGGNVYMFTGLLDKLETDDAIASVLAHEIGHCAAKHTIKKFQAALGYNLIGNILLRSLSPNETSQQVATLSSAVISTLVFSAYGRKDEYEADRLGVKYLHLAGYDVQGAVQALEVLKQESKEGHTPLILRSHPYLDDRIEALKTQIATLPNEELE